MSQHCQKTEIIRCRADGTRITATDLVSAEQPLELRVRGQSVAITMRTPGHDRELAAGFSVAEGIVRRSEHLVEVAHCRRGEATHPENVVNVFLAANAPCDLTKLSRHVFASSSCGICGKATLEAIKEQWSPIESDFSISASRLLALPSRLKEAQSEFQRTGGLHAAALFTRDGKMVCIREDVGRHNAVDKVIGWSLLQRRFPLADRLLLVSGRTSFEIMQKALAARVPFVAAVSAPSSLAVEFALENRQTLVGFLRNGTFNAYAHPQRILH